MKCATFNNADIPPEVRAKMAADRAKAEQRDYYVTVCAECGQSSCWLGIFMCQQSDHADTMQMKASELDELGYEHPDYYSRETLMRHCGAISEVQDADK